MRQLFCYAFHNGYSKIELEDDALFANRQNSECLYRALIYRLFQNKKSIYEKYGFVPNTNRNVDKLRRDINLYTIGEVKKEIQPILDYLRQNARPRFQQIMDYADDTQIFGEYIINLQCSNLRFMINELLYLSSKIKKNENTPNFLVLLDKYYKAYKKLIVEPTCNDSSYLVRQNTLQT